MHDILLIVCLISVGLVYSGDTRLPQYQHCSKLCSSTTGERFIHCVSLLCRDSTIAAAAICGNFFTTMAKRDFVDGSTCSMTCPPNVARCQITCPPGRGAYCSCVEYPSIPQCVCDGFE